MQQRLVFFGLFWTLLLHLFIPTSAQESNDNERRQGAVAGLFAVIADLAECDVQLSFQSDLSDNKEFNRFVGEDLPKAMNDRGLSLTLIDVNEALVRGWIIPPFKDSNLTRCITNVIAIQDGYLMKEYLELRRKSGFLYQKNWKHIFISGELRGLSANNGTSLYEVYSTLEFQLHAHSVFFEFSSGDCLGAKPSSDCRIDGFYFDSFGSYRAVYYLVYRPLLPKFVAPTSYEEIFPDILSDMKGYNYKVATLPYLPFVKKHSDSTYSGIEIRLAGFISHLYNFTFTLIEPPDGAWGKPDENGVWSGLVGHAAYGMSNWSMSGLAVDPTREDIIDFAYHHTAEYFDWVGPLPTENPKWPAIFKPFTVFVWICVIAAALVSGPVLAFLDRYSPPDPKSRIRDLGTSYLFTLSALFKDISMANAGLPNRESPRVFLAGWWMFTLIIYTAYTANLMAFMTSPGMQPPIDTPQMVLDTDIKIDMYNYQGSTTLAFSSTENPVYKEIWNKKTWITSFSGAYLDAIEGKSVFMDYRVAMESAVYGQWLDALGRSRLHLAGYNTFHFPTAWATSPKNMFRETLNMGILIAIQTGHMDRFKTITNDERRAETIKNTPASERPKIPNEAPEQPLTVEDLQGPLYMYGVFMGTCLLAFLLEAMGNIPGLRMMSRQHAENDEWARPAKVIHVDMRNKF